MWARGLAASLLVTIALPTVSAATRHSTSVRPYPRRGLARSQAWESNNDGLRQLRRHHFIEGAQPPFLSAGVRYSLLLEEYPRGVGERTSLPGAVATSDPGATLGRRRRLAVAAVRPPPGDAQDGESIPHRG